MNSAERASRTTRLLPVSERLDEDTDVETNMPPDLWQELNREILREAKNWSDENRLCIVPTPRQMKVMLPLQDTVSSVPGGGGRRALSSTDGMSREINGPPVPSPSPPRQRVPCLRQLFIEFGTEGINPTDYQGLWLLHSATEESAKACIYWEQESALQRKIREKQEEYIRAHEQRTAAWQQALQKQHSALERDVYAKTSGSEISATHSKSPSMVSGSGTTGIMSIEERKAKIAADRLARAKARADLLESLKEAEEDNRDLQDAAQRVRSKWEEAKGKYILTQNEELLDNY